ncbi:MAG TPA: adenylate/guanylate cyclase domain-containing protein [Mycobacteriales bacterium]|nr:adenylate/guanylate cyclase domain-containing protein [Mycobacteriales bacterium]
MTPGADHPARSQAPGADQPYSAHLEQTLLGEAAHLTRDEVEQRSGVDVEVARALWRALGFPDPDPEVPAYTEADVDALERVARLRATSGIDEVTAEGFARVYGQALSHLAETQVGILLDRLAQEPHLVDLAQRDLEAAVLAILDVWRAQLPDLEGILVYTWRRHLLAAAQRALSGLATEMPEDAIAVGFADVVGYTSLTRDMTAAELEELVVAFERGAYDAIVTHGGRVVKTLGDEVMFVASSPHAATEIGLLLADSFGLERSIVPPVRVGIAWGPALARGGDVLGPVVNVASRCCALARPGTLLVDREMAKALKDDDAFSVRPMRPRAVRGYGHLLASSVRWARGHDGIVSEA